MYKYWINKLSNVKAELVYKNSEYYYLRRKGYNSSLVNIAEYKEFFTLNWMPIASKEFFSSLDFNGIMAKRNAKSYNGQWRCIKTYHYPSGIKGRVYWVAGTTENDVLLKPLGYDKGFTVEKWLMEEYFKELDKPVSATEGNKNLEVGGSHYQTAIQPWDYIAANHLGFDEGSIIKYITRHRKKNGAEDIKKAISFCKHILETQYGEKQ